MVIDVSYHEGAIDWRKVKNSGVQGVIIRCGYGRDFQKYDDKLYKANIEGALAVGLKVGVYLYSYAKDNDAARSEAAHALRLIEPYKDKITLPIYYDLEEPGTEKGAKERAVIFCETLKAKGYTVGVYANIDWWKNYLNGLEQYTKWVASWRASGKPENKPVISNMDLWQYYAYGTIDGITPGRVDLSEAYGFIADILNGNNDNKEVFDMEFTTIRKGSEGSEVKTLQRQLKELGYKGENKKVLAIDGKAGANTVYAIKAFQAANKDMNGKPLQVDGIAGEKTLTRLYKGC